MTTLRTLRLEMMRCSEWEPWNHMPCVNLIRQNRGTLFQNIQTLRIYHYRKHFTNHESCTKTFQIHYKQKADFDLSCAWSSVTNQNGGSLGTCMHIQTLCDDSEESMKETQGKKKKSRAISQILSINLQLGITLQTILLFSYFNSNLYTSNTNILF